MYLYYDLCTCPCNYVEPCIIDGEKLILKYAQHGWAYKNEKNAYLVLQNEDFLPKLRYFDDKHSILAITDVGRCVQWMRQDEVNTKDYEEQLVNIFNTMRDKYNLYHNEILTKNMCIDKDDKIRLIDFDCCSREKRLGADKHYEIIRSFFRKKN